MFLRTLTACEWSPNSRMLLMVKACMASTYSAQSLSLYIWDIKSIKFLRCLASSATWSFSSADFFCFVLLFGGWFRSTTIRFKVLFFVNTLIGGNAMLISFRSGSSNDSCCELAWQLLNILLTICKLYQLEQIVAAVEISLYLYVRLINYR